MSALRHVLSGILFSGKNRLQVLAKTSGGAGFGALVGEELSITDTIETVVTGSVRAGFAPIFPDTCYHLTHYWLAAVDIPVASDNPVHYADAIRYNARTPLQGSLLPLTRLVWA